MLDALKSPGTYCAYATSAGSSSYNQWNDDCTPPLIDDDGTPPGGGADVDDGGGDDDDSNDGCVYGSNPFEVPLANNDGHRLFK
eukprot:5386460-Karenia_brevis.AAC.1